MRLKFADFNGADVLFGQDYAEDAETLKRVISSLPLHLKASDQAGKKGTPIFDPVGTNATLKESLLACGWRSGLAIPAEFAFLGTDVDFVKRGLLVEVQFSNYPFFLNNIIRSELFFKAGVRFDKVAIRAAAIVTKAHMFPASNSTLYYEQALSQLKELSRHGVFDVPVRLIGLFEDPGEHVHVVWSTYDATRYSRTVVERKEGHCSIRGGRGDRGRCAIGMPGLGQ